MAAHGTYVALSFAPPVTGTAASYVVEYLPLEDDGGLLTAPDGGVLEGTEATEGSSPFSVSTTNPALLALADGGLELDLHGLAQNHGYRFSLAAADSSGVASVPAGPLDARTPLAFTWALPLHDQQLNDARCLAGTSRCYAAGNAGALLRSDDSGHTWTQVDPGAGSQYNNALNTAFGGFWQVAFPDATQPDVGYLVSKNRNSAPLLGATRAPLLVRKTVDGARTWMDVTPPGQTSDTSAAIACLDTQTCWVDLSGNLFATTDGAASWTALHTSGASGAPGRIHRMRVLSATTLLALDTSDIWLSTDAGATWTQRTSAQLSGPWDFDMNPAASTHGIWVGDGSNATTGAYHTTTNFGAVSQSTYADSHPYSYFHQVQYVDAGAAVIVGDLSSIYVTLDDGTSLSPTSDLSTVANAQTIDLLGASAIDSDHAIFVGASADTGGFAVAYSTDNLLAGANLVDRGRVLPSWSNGYSVGNQTIRGGVAVDAHTFIGCDAAGYVLVTLDDGLTFSEAHSDLQACQALALVPTLTTAGSATVVIAGTTNGTLGTQGAETVSVDRALGTITINSSTLYTGFSCNGNLSGLAVNGSDVVAVGQHLCAYASPDVGATWAAVSAPGTGADLAAVTFSDANDFWAVGQFANSGAFLWGNRATTTWSASQPSWPTSNYPAGGYNILARGTNLYVFSTGYSTSTSGLAIVDTTQLTYAFVPYADGSTMGGCFPAVRAAACSSDNDCIVAGGDTNLGCNSMTWVTHDRGATWKPSWDWAGAPVSGYYGISMADAQNGYLWGIGRLVRAWSGAE